MWLTAAGLAVWRGPDASIIMLEVGGFLVSQATELLIRAAREVRSVPRTRSGPRQQIAFVQRLSMPLLLPVGLYRLNSADSVTISAPIELVDVIARRLTNILGPLAIPAERVTRAAALAIARSSA
jgi:hypothetical protein